MDVETKPRRIAEREEARQRARDDDRIGDHHVLIGMAELVLRPGHSHDLHGAIEGRDVEADFGRAVRRDGNHSREQSERRLRRRLTHSHAAHIVAAGADPAARGAHAVDQLPIEITHFRAELALCEGVFVGGRGLRSA